MATLRDVQRFALTLPGTSADDDGCSVRVGEKQKGFVWRWKERIDPKKPRVPNPRVLAVRVADLDDKEVLLALDREKFFTEPHYNGFPAVLVRLPALRMAELRPLVEAAWRCLAPRALQDELDRQRAAPKTSRGARRRPLARS